MPLVGLEPGPFDPESSALTTGPLTPHHHERAFRLCSIKQVFTQAQQVQELRFVLIL